MSKSRLPFPFEFKELEPEEKLKVLQAYKVSEVTPQCDFVSVGPKNYKQLRPYCDEAADLYNIEVRSDDIFTVTYPRSGTTRTQELIWLIANDYDYETAKSVGLNKRFPFVESLKLSGTEWQDDFLENANDKEEALKFLRYVKTPTTDKLSSITSPRFLKTHLALSLLPPTLLDTAKVVYVARDPRDVAVSYFHLHKLIKIFHFPGTFKKFWNLFVHDLVKLTPIFEHVKEAWNLRDHPNMLFLFYEDFSKDPPASIRQIASFLGKEVTEEEINRLCDHLNIENFKKNSAVNSDYMKKVGLFTDNEQFIRKGKVGGWRDYFDDEMTQQAEQWIADNLRDTDLRFPHF